MNTYKKRDDRGITINNKREREREMKTDKNRTTGT